MDSVKLKTFLVTNKYFQTLVRAENMDLALAQLADSQKGKDFKAVEVTASTNLLPLLRKNRSTMKIENKNFQTVD